MIIWTILNFHAFFLVQIIRGRTWYVCWKVICQTNTMRENLSNSETNKKRKLQNVPTSIVVDPTTGSNHRFDKNIIFTTNSSFSGRRHLHRQWDIWGDFVNLNISWINLSKVLRGVGCVCMFIRGTINSIVTASDQTTPYKRGDRQHLEPNVFLVHVHVSTHNCQS
jgi:hypothetical protein